MRLALSLAALLVAACSEPREQARTAEERSADESIECAIGGGDFERSCTMDRQEGAEGLTITIRNEAGGFRRLLLPRDGSGAVAADGAEPARVRVLGDGRAEVAIGGDRYRLPAAIGPAPRPR